MKQIKQRISFGICLAIGLSLNSYAQEISTQNSAAPNTSLKSKTSLKKVVEDVPTLKNLYRVSATRTPSGFPVPRYVSLKVGKVNGRTGPSRQHSIAWQYQRRGLPLVVVAETDMWRKVRDVQGDESWVHKPALSGKRRVMVMQTSTLHTRPRDTARIKASLAPNALMTLIECNHSQWCLVQSDNGIKGWTPQNILWGAGKLY